MHFSTSPYSVWGTRISQTMTEPLGILLSVWEMFSICALPPIILIADSVFFQIHGTGYLMVPRSWRSLHWPYHFELLCPLKTEALTLHITDYESLFPPALCSRSLTPSNFQALWLRSSLKDYVYISPVWGRINTALAERKWIAPFMLTDWVEMQMSRQ